MFKGEKSPEKLNRLMKVAGVFGIYFSFHQVFILKLFILFDGYKF